MPRKYVPPQEKRELASRLLATRQRFTLSQAEASNMLGIPKRTWQHWEQAVTAIPPYMLPLIEHELERIAEKKK